MHHSVRRSCHSILLDVATHRFSGVRKSTRERHPPKRTMDEFLLSADARLKLAQSERSKVPQLSRAAVKRVVAQYKQDRKDAQASVSRNSECHAAG